MNVKSRLVSEVFTADASVLHTVREQMPESIQVNGNTRRELVQCGKSPVFDGFIHFASVCLWLIENFVLTD